MYAPPFILTQAQVESLPSESLLAELFAPIDRQSLLEKLRATDPETWADATVDDIPFGPAFAKPEKRLP